MTHSSWLSLLSSPATRPLSPVLPPAVAQLETDKQSWTHREIDAHVLSEIVQRDPFPLPATEDREDYHGERHLDYWLSGYRDFRQLTDIYQRHTGKRLASATVLDWGCASGRVMRHFAYQGENIRVIGVDMKHAHCEWVRRHLDHRIAAFPITAVPHLPIADATFDLAYGYSVLTHVGEFDTTWIAELSRVIKPGGLICVSILGDHAWSRMKPGFMVYDALANVRDHLDQKLDFGPGYFASTVLDRFYVSWSSLDPVYNTVGFHSHKHVRAHWGKIAQVLEISTAAVDYQDMVVLSRL